MTQTSPASLTLVHMGAHIYSSILLLTILMAISSANSVNVHGQVSVLCPFSLTLIPATYYLPANSISLNLSLMTLTNCTIPSLHGNITIKNSLGSVVDFETEAISNEITDAPANTAVSFNAIGISGGTYLANLTLYSATYSNSSTANIVVLTPANIMLSNLSIGSSALNLPLQISMDLHNDGNLSSGTISIFVYNVEGKWSNFTISASALSPSQSSSISSSRSGLTQYPGTYTVRAYAEYNNGVSTVRSATVNATYYVQSSTPTPPTPSHGSGGLPGPAPPPSGTSLVTSLSTLVITEAPLTTYLTPTTSSSGSMGLQNTANSTATISLSMPPQFSKYIQFSQSTFLLEPRQVGYINIIVNPSGMPAGSYYVPINLSTTVNGNTQSRIEYYLLDIYGNQSKAVPQVLTYVQMLESGNQASVALKISAPAAAPISNATITTYIPASAVQNASSIYTYGLASSVELVNGSYAIQFNVPYVRANGSTYIYYQIKDPLLQSVLGQLNTTLAEKSASNNNIQILGISAQTMHAGQQSAVDVYVLYTGTENARVYFDLATSPTSQSDLAISNPLRLVNVTPNQVINQIFTVKAGNSTGQSVLNLRISYGSEVLSYPITVSVLPTIQSFSIPVSADYRVYAAAAAIILAASAAALYLRLSRPKVRPNVASKLEAINEKVKGV